MPDDKADTKGRAGMSGAGNGARRGGQPALGEAALREAIAGFGVTGAVPPASGARSTGAGDATAQDQGIAPKTVSQVLGEITWLMTQSPRHKAIPLGDLEWRVMPAILLQQFRLFYNGEQPVGVALWALADDLVAKRIDGGDVRLAAAEWKSGPHQRIVDIIAPFGGEAEMQKKFAQALHLT